ncbi:MAG: HNH endonuclease [Dehalococcoidia bacterium]
MRAGHRCEYCRAPEVVFNFPFEVEHIIPPAHGGTDQEDNFALSCRACNVRKGPHVRHTDPVTQSVVRLYHPRTEPWEDHFRVDVLSGTIEGLTAIGRSTVSRMSMNTPAQLEARRLWIRLGLFP